MMTPSRRTPSGKHTTSVICMYKCVPIVIDIETIDYVNRSINLLHDILLFSIESCLATDRRTLRKWMRIRGRRQAEQPRAYAMSLAGRSENRGVLFPRCLCCRLWPRWSMIIESIVGKYRVDSASAKAIRSCFNRRFCCIGDNQKMKSPYIIGS